MARWAAFLRAVNVGGTGLLKSADLAKLCGACGFTDVKTVLASGNAVFTTSLGEAAATKKLEAALAAHQGARVAAFLRTGDALRVLLDDNPFPRAPHNRVIVSFAAAPLADDVAARAKGRVDEEILVRGRELWVHYPRGQGVSKLRLPCADVVTGRNLSTIMKVAALCGA